MNNSEKVLNYFKKCDSNLDSYIAHDGTTCYRTFGPFAWFELVCGKFNLAWEMLNSYYATAKGNGFTIDYCEHDIILALNA